MPVSSWISLECEERQDREKESKREKERARERKRERERAAEMEEGRGKRGGKEREREKVEREQNKREERLRELAAATEKVKEIERKRKEKEEERDKENAWNLEIKRQEIAKAQHKLGEDLLEMIKKTDKETLEGGNMNRKHEVTKTPKEEAMKISSNEEKVHPMMDPTNLTKLQLKKGICGGPYVLG